MFLKYLKFTKQNHSWLKTILFQSNSTLLLLVNVMNVLLVKRTLWAYFLAIKHRNLSFLVTMIFKRSKCYFKADYKISILWILSIKFSKVSCCKVTNLGNLKILICSFFWRNVGDNTLLFLNSSNGLHVSHMVTASLPPRHMQRACDK